MLVLSVKKSGVSFKLGIKLKISREGPYAYA
jgi:hypothetical protein